MKVDPARAVRRKQAARDQVRVAYGELPAILEGLPADDPFRSAIRDRARSLLVELGYLTVEELNSLTVTDAIATALPRLRAEPSRAAPAIRPGRRSAGAAPRAA